MAVFPEAQSPTTRKKNAAAMHSDSHCSSEPQGSLSVTNVVAIHLANLLMVEPEAASLPKQICRSRDGGDARYEAAWSRPRARLATSGNHNES